MRAIRALGCALILAAATAGGCEKREQPADHAAPRVVTTKGGVEMVLAPGGTFRMGGGDEAEGDETPHDVTLSAFYIDKYEVTQAEYQRLMGRNPSKWADPACPVDQVRWADAVAYCNQRSVEDGLTCAYDLKTGACDFWAAGYRLPTEAEWEYAARASAATRYHFGPRDDALGRHAWYAENRGRRPRPVGQKQPNGWGLYDMYGNVWEWCNDYYAADYYQRSPVQDPPGPAQGKTRVVRGGCWSSRPKMCSSTHRNNEKPAYTDVCFGKDVHGFVGLRCVRRPAR